MPIFPPYILLVVMHMHLKYQYFLNGTLVLVMKLDPCDNIRFAIGKQQSLCLMHNGKPTGMAVSHCITWFQTQLILTTCQIRYHSHLWDHRSTGQL